MVTYLKSIRYKDNVINLSNEERKHLIITGKNGSGKTSMLQAIKKQLMLIEQNDAQMPKEEKDNNLLTEKYTNLLKQLSDEEKLFWLMDGYVNRLENEISKNNKKKKYVALEFNQSHDDNYFKSILQNGFIIAFFDSKRAFSFEKPQGITVNATSRYSIKDQAGAKFVQYLVNLKADRAFAYEEGNLNKVESIDKWFNSFEENLQELFETEKLELYFDRKKLEFYVKFEGKIMNLHRLSDGFSSLIFIISEIIMRMRNKRRHKEEGIVIIDEIETHLHVSLQKKVLRFLTSFFPNVQFIVSTHSPFVLSSIDNAIVYDMETKEQIRDMSIYSYESIIENYFRVDQYSHSIKDRFDDYLQLSKQEESLSLRDTEKLNYLREYLESIPDSIAPELKSHYYHLEIMRKSEME
ncbi:hypothetical protein CK938_05285 [Bacillus cereus]|nr:hypothetical protein CK938_05285 [Bacillus cereus]